MSPRKAEDTSGATAAAEPARTWLLSILLECPFGRAMECCPLREARLLPLRNKMEIVDKIDASAIDALIDYHRNCLVVRERHSGLSPGKGPCELRANHFFRPGLTRQGTWIDGHSE